MTSLQACIDNDDGAKLVAKLEAQSWDGKSLIQDDDDRLSLHPLLRAVDLASYSCVDALLEHYGGTVLDVNVMAPLNGESSQQQQQEVTSALHLACEKADYRLIDALLGRAGGAADPNLTLPCTNGGKTPLWSLNEHLDVLIPRGQIDRLRVLSLELSGHAEQLIRINLACRRRLLEAGARVNDTREGADDEEEETLLHVDCMKRRNDHASLLIQYGATSRANARGLREMDVCLLTLNPDLLRILHAATGGDGCVFGFADAGETPLSVLAAQMRKVAMRDDNFWYRVQRTLQAYLDVTPDVHADGPDGRSLLSLCVVDLPDISEERAMTLVQAMTRRGVNLHHPSHHHRLPLTEACATGNRGMVNALLRHDDTVVHGRDARFGQTAVFDCKSVDILQDLIAAGANVEDCNDNAHQTPLLHAARCASERRVVALLQVGANVHVVDRHGWSPLHWASWTGDVVVLEALLQDGADVHVRDRYGRTPLHLWGLLVEDVPDDDDDEEVEQLLPAAFFVEHALEGTMAETGRASADEKGLQVLIQHGADPTALDHANNLPFAYLAAANQDGAHLSPLYTLVRLAASSGLFG